VLGRRIVKTAVITTVHGRRTHLVRQLDGLARGTRLPDLHIVVALGDPSVAGAVAGHQPSVLHVPASRPLPVALGRNLGAAAALRKSVELLVFLDVDCIPGVDLIERYHTVARQAAHRDALLCGPVTYLPPAGPDGYILSELPIDPHPARPAPEPATVIRTTEYALFWSLSFAVRAATWRRIGGFCAEYRGYGGEDTDFAQCAAARDVSMLWVGGAHAFHQHHPVDDPPVGHLEDIVRNAEVFHRRWGWWPMEGWLASFESAGLIYREAGGRPVRTQIT